jgi:hypothetical protein
MPGLDHTFGGGSTDTAIGPIVLVVMLMAIVLILSLPGNM